MQSPVFLLPVGGFRFGWPYSGLWTQCGGRTDLTANRRILQRRLASVKGFTLSSRGTARRLCSKRSKTGVMSQSRARRSHPHGAAGKVCRSEASSSKRSDTVRRAPQAAPVSVANNGADATLRIPLTPFST